MKNPYERLADAVNNHTWIVAGGVAVAVFLLACFGLTMVTMQTGDDTYIDKDTPPGARSSLITRTPTAPTRSCSSTRRTVSEIPRSSGISTISRKTSGTNATSMGGSPASSTS
ncbi:sodium/potassium-transporting ATPase subunit beta family protein [Methanoculleus chikugoensis]|uniref:sodium/potassium-transporting ATPase subunit beta family protein n=1 Tax=Methanoculleus chikugoensis TaxID=118126 RepID=UPI001FB42ADA|nr:sodium/potassium-transporting ATPase subunit beta family protein [Methanoculleus chikugoensis]